MINVQLTQDYRLTTDGTQFIVKERKIVDPTRAPGYKAPEDGSTPPLSERWVDAGYYGYTASGLAAALDGIRMRLVARGDAETLAEFVAAIKTETERIVQAFSHGEIRDFDVKLAS